MVFFDHPYMLAALIFSLVVFLMGICLLFISVPPNERLYTYRKSRRVLACAYFVLAVSGLYALFGNQDEDQRDLVATVTMSVAALQAFMFTYAIVSLINLRVTPAGKVRRHLLSVVFAVAILFSAILLPDRSVWAAVIEAAFILFYICLIIFYVRIFLREFKGYRMQMDNYFSHDEWKRLRWLNIAFFAAVMTGCMALVSIWVNKSVYAMFLYVYAIFYLVFAIKYINYTTIFNAIMSAVVSDNNEKPPMRYDLKELDRKVSKWIKEKRFVRSDITLESLAGEIGTNRTYLSAYINRTKGKNFKTWIGELRMEEAVKLIRENPDITLTQLGHLIGITDRGSFNRMFSSFTGETPTNFRKKIKKESQTGPSGGL